MLSPFPPALRWLMFAQWFETQGVFSPFFLFLLSRNCLHVIFCTHWWLLAGFIYAQTVLANAVWINCRRFAQVSLVWFCFVLFFFQPRHYWNDSTIFLQCGSAKRSLLFLFKTKNQVYSTHSPRLQTFCCNRLETAYKHVAISYIYIKVHHV